MICSLAVLIFCALPVSAKTQSYSIHLSSFKEIDNAIKEVSRFKELGYNAFYRYEKVKGKGKYYRVYIGTFNDEHTARKIGSDLKRKGMVLYFNPIKFFEKIKAIIKEQPAVKIENSRNETELIEVNEEGKEALDKNVKIVDRQEDENRSTKYLGINKQGTSITDKWRIDSGTCPQFSFVPSYRVNKTFSIYGGVEKIFLDGPDLSFVMFGPKYSFYLSDRFSLYYKAGMAYGDFDWSVTAPGNIENIKGWESVFGFEFIKSQIRLGFDFLYRDIEFDYKAPSGQGVSTNQNSIGYSGYSIKGTFSFFF